MSQRTASQDRAVCDHCGLPHYTDRTGCPYCEMAGLDGGSASKSDVVEDATTAGGESEQRSLLGRLKRTLGI